MQFDLNMKSLAMTDFEVTFSFISAPSAYTSTPPPHRRKAPQLRLESVLFRGFHCG
jgi:hypothetical protein